jgi:hypothetical protein
MTKNELDISNKNIIKIGCVIIVAIIACFVLISFMPFIIPIIFAAFIIFFGFLASLFAHNQITETKNIESKVHFESILPAKTATSFETLSNAQNKQDKDRLINALYGNTYSYFWNSIPKELESDQEVVIALKTNLINKLKEDYSNWKHVPENLKNDLEIKNALKNSFLSYLKERPWNWDWSECPSFIKESKELYEAVIIGWAKKIKDKESISLMPSSIKEDVIKELKRQYILILKDNSDEYFNIYLDLINDKEILEAYQEGLNKRKKIIELTIGNKKFIINNAHLYSQSQLEIYKAFLYHGINAEFKFIETGNPFWKERFDSYNSKIKLLNSDYKLVIGNLQEEIRKNINENYRYLSRPFIVGDNDHEKAINNIINLLIDHGVIREIKPVDSNGYVISFREEILNSIDPKLIDEIIKYLKKLPIKRNEFDNIKTLINYTTYKDLSNFN